MLPGGDVNVSVIRQQAALFVEDGVAGAFVCSTTGEGPSLTTKERFGVAEAWLAARTDGFIVIVNVGHNRLREARAMAAHAAEAGADAVAMHPPCYFRPHDTRALVDCCLTVAEAAPGLPFYYYHIPPLTGVRPRMAEFLESARGRIPTFRGARFSDPNLAEFRACLDRCEGALDILFGVDEMLLGALAMGCTRAIGSTYCYAAPHYLSMIRAFHAGDMVSSRAIARRIVGLAEASFEVDTVAAGKACMALRGIDCGPVRAPLRNLTGEERSRLEGRLYALGIFPPPARLP